MTLDPATYLRDVMPDPKAHLGMHPLPDGSLRLRAFIPWAEGGEVLDRATGATVAPLAPGGFPGLWEAQLPAQPPFPYVFRLWNGGGSWVAEDPYRFGAVLGEADRYLLAEGTHLNLHEALGAHPRTFGDVAGVAFAVWAPNARRVSVVGPFNHWDGRVHPLQRYGDGGYWELFIPHLQPGEGYAFELEDPNGGLLPLKADPCAARMEAPASPMAFVEGPPRHTWNDGTWMTERLQRNRHTAPISLYEVHAGSWRRRGDGSFLSYRELADQLVPYVAELGFTHVQFLPLSEHPFYASWGYQPLGLFAPTCRFGTPDDLRHLVDRFHQAGIGVVLDWVPAHFPEDAHGLGAFDGTHLYEHADPRKGRHMDWGTLIYNFGRTEVQNVLIANALSWLDQFHFDGLRVDAVASMLYLDYSRRHGQWVPNIHGGRENLEAVAFLRRLNATVYREHPGTLTVAEESTAWPGVSRPTDTGGLGFGFKWNMGWMHDTLRFLGRSMLHRKYHHSEITFSMLYQDSENYVLPLSHDEVVHGKKSLLWRMPGTRWEQFANLRLLYAYQWAHPGKKLLFMGGEFGQDHEWDHNKGLDWHLLDHEPHRGVQRLVGDLNRLYRAEPALHERDCEPGGLQWIDCNDRVGGVLSFVRQGFDPQDLMVVVMNLTAQPREGYRIGVPRPGPWVERLNSDAACYGGQNWGNQGRLQAEEIPCHGHPWSLLLTAPPLGAIFLQPEKHNPDPSRR